MMNECLGGTVQFIDFLGGLFLTADRALTSSYTTTTN